MAATVVKTSLLVKGRKVGTKAKYLQEENNLDGHKNTNTSSAGKFNRISKLCNFPIKQSHYRPGQAQRVPGS